MESGPPLGIKRRFSFRGVGVDIKFILHFTFWNNIPFVFKQHLQSCLNHKSLQWAKFLWEDETCRIWHTIEAKLPAVWDCTSPVNRLTCPWLWPDHAACMMKSVSWTRLCISESVHSLLCTLQSCWFSGSCLTWEMRLLSWQVRQPSLNEMLYQRSEEGPHFPCSSHTQ